MHTEDILDSFRIVTGNLITTEADAIVNPTDSSFSGTGGLDYAIRKAAGAQLARVLPTGGKTEEGTAVITPAFDIKTAKWIIHTVGPKWKTGFCSEEYLLAECYRQSLRCALQNNCKSIAFPCISIGANGFPAERAAEIALRSVYYMLSAAESPELERVVFVCNGEHNAAIYKKHLKRLILDTFLQNYSPESFTGSPSFSKYFLYMKLLGHLEWADLGRYQEFMDNISKDSQGCLSNKYTSYDSYAMNMDTWDYDTCLAYIIYLQRASYWSGGLEAPHYDQYANGIVRKVLLRMKMLLG